MSGTKLSKFCDGLIEAGWLAALIIAPLFFNTYSSRVFEPDKSSVIRLIALVMLAAWLIKLIEEGGLHFKYVERLPRRWLDTVLRIPLVLPLLILFTSFLLSSVLSIAPRPTWFGSYTRLQGVYTTAAYLIIFVSIAMNLRRRAQVERLITTVIITSLPISLYGLMQRLLIDPLPWGEDTVQRVTSSMGNAIFVGSYLIMAIPLTLMRCLQSYRAIIYDKERLGEHIARAIVYTITVLAQLVALWFSGSRGPLLGLLMGIFFWFVLMSLVFKKRTLTLSTLGVAGLLGVFLLSLNIPNGPFESIRNSENIVGRLGRVFDQGGTGRIRELIWEGAVKMALPHDPYVYPDGKPDPFNLLRPLIGHGPETVYVGYNPFYIPELAHYEKRSATPDRSHNETFDALLTTGFVGTIAYLAFFAAVIYYSLKWIGVIAPTDKWLYLGLYAGGGLLGSVVMVWWRGPAYFGVGLPFGIIIGLLLYLTFIALKRTPAEIDLWRGFVLVSLLSAIVAHFVEIHFGIAITSTRTHYWAFVGVMLVVGFVMPKIAAQAETATAPTTARTESKRRITLPPRRANPLAAMFPSFLSGLILITLTYDMVANARQLTSFSELFRAFMTTLYGTTGETSYGIPLLLGIVWLSAALLWSEDREVIVMTVIGSLAVWLAFTVAHLAGLVRIANYQPNSLKQLIELLDLINGVFASYAWWVLLSLLVLGISLAPDMPLDFFKWNVQVVFAPLVFSVAIVAGYFTNIMTIQADMTYKVAQPLDRQQRWDIAIPVYQQAIRLAADQDQYYLYLGRAYLESASRLTDRVQQETILSVARSELEKAQTLNPLNPDHSANLARMVQFWARTTSDPNEADVRLNRAAEYYNTALRLSPNTPWLWNEAARFYMVARKDYPTAQGQIEHALQVDPQLAETYTAYAEFWTQRGLDEKDPQKQRAYYQKAIDAYRQALQAEIKLDKTTELNARANMASLQRGISDTVGAIVTYKNIVDEADKNYNLWEVYRALAELYLQNGDKPAALNYANKALAAAPAVNKPAIQNLITTIGK